ncbi:MAG: RNHCP domain-containing protein [Candidatus Micrarchaeaceae archaeon]
MAIIDGRRGMPNYNAANYSKKKAEMPADRLRAPKPKKFQKRKEDFVCAHCGAYVKGNGYTDHCPNCLYSKHVDINPGDRAAECGGMMRPISAEYDKANFIIHYECEKCHMHKNVKAAENDNKELLFRLMQGSRRYNHDAAAGI